MEDVQRIIEHQFGNYPLYFMVYGYIFGLAPLWLYSIILITYFYVEREFTLVLILLPGFIFGFAETFIHLLFVKKIGWTNFLSWYY